ncbi:phage terminase small subunit P27 family [Conexibacter arvalis]|uniref:P27 family predicted phage terminase small subunit n=1 Tax=Conexibacter arvalis TaxID=912552 RepID=A0A840IGU3_9ACTN|nr:phage terminase small subunit P27 family [Conexibacter arvalis]MBB4663170.1 P27 family predicted phage terminase small subunit [Conexibacter arvalis]
MPEELVDPPEHLPKDAQEFWREVVPQLASIGMVDRIDKVVLELLCTQYARARQAQRVVTEDGHFALGAAGQIKEHPAVKIEREATIVFLRLCEQVGIGPVARARLGLASLHGRALANEMDSAFGPVHLTPVGQG